MGYQLQYSGEKIFDIIKNALLSKRKIMIVIKSESCGHCVQFSKIWNQMAGFASRKYDMIAVDAEDKSIIEDMLSKMDDKFELMGYPTLLKLDATSINADTLVFSWNQFKGPRSIDSLNIWMKSK